MTATHPAEAANLIPESLFESNSLIDAFSSKASIKDSSAEVHALTILARMLADEELSRQAKPMNPEGLFQLMKDNGPVVLRYVEDWKFDASDPATVNRKLAELYWALALIYVSTWNPGELLYNDFFLYVFSFYSEGSLMLTSGPSECTLLLRPSSCPPFYPSSRPKTSGFF